MFYAVRHFTRYVYSKPVWETMMEVRMHARSEHTQRCFTFQLSVSPRARIFSYADHVGNLVHHFDIPAHHRQLTIIADSLVDVEAGHPIPESLGPGAWEDLDRLVASEDYWDMLTASHFARTSPELELLGRELGVAARNGRDPIELLRKLNHDIHRTFEYDKESTDVDSPIEHALVPRKGVCQDFAHIMIALVRNLGIPCRYVSGYVFHDQLRERSESATHAWLEAMLPGLGWVGFDPTHNMLVGDHHIRTAIGRDYADVPPTLGTMKGNAASKMQVRVRVTPSEAVLPPDQEFAADEEWSRFLEQDSKSQSQSAQQQRQQQQQQQ